jgi:hypothetical protein
MRLTMVSSRTLLDCFFADPSSRFYVLGLHSSDAMQLLLQQYIHGIRDDP